MVFCIQRAVLGIGCLALSVSSALANPETPPADDPMTAYRAYETAITENKLVDAAGHAQAAWTRAEAKWGSANPNTAGLAYNAAWSAALAGRARDGLDAAKRAVELAPLANQSYALNEAQFLLANAEFEGAPKSEIPKKAHALDVAAKAVEGSWGDLLVSDALLRAAIHFSVIGKSRKGAELTERSFAKIQRLKPTDSDRFALISLARAIAKLSDRDKLSTAYEDIIKARVAYGRMRSPDDSTWGMLSAWQMVVNGLIQANQIRPQSTGSRLNRGQFEPRDLSDEEASLIMTSKPECKELANFKRKRVGRDIAPMSVGYFSVNLGGVQVLTDLSPEGHVINPRVTGSVPDMTYAEASLKGISTWQYNIPANVPATCLKDYQISVAFTME